MVWFTNYILPNSWAKSSYVLEFSGVTCQQKKLDFKFGSTEKEAGVKLHKRVLICNLRIPIIIIINPVLIWFYPRKWGWPDLPHSASNLSHSPSCLILFIFLQTNTLTLLLHLRSPCLPRSSSLPLSLHFNLKCLPQNMAINPP